ncbi:hypothetical protein [Halobellus salinisoli]|uniref:hypothetical protein n=1 Tax=Halobellus salinisoli TaxID=3108500 RepID=UPI0030097D4B
MKRRNLLAGFGTLIAGTGAALGTGAFSTVSAERSFTVSTTDDSGADLQLEMGGGAVADSVVSNNSTTGAEGEEIEFDFGDNVNNEALTAFDGILRITNNSDDDDVEVTELTFRPEDDGGNLVDSDDDDTVEVLSVYVTGHGSDLVNGDGEDPLDSDFDDDTDNNVLTADDDDFGADGDGDTLGNGDSVEVGFLFDTTGDSNIGDIENIVIVAETSESGDESSS